MTQEILELRRKGLEETFFARLNEELLERLRTRVEERSKKEDLSALSGIQDEAVLDELVAVGIDAGSLAALGIIPLIQVAWADGKIQERERQAILEGAAKVGIEPGGPGHQLLGAWLEDPPGPRLFTAWKDYVSALQGVCDEGSRRALRIEVLARAEALAKVAGGILGVGSVSHAERRVLSELDDALAT